MKNLNGGDAGLDWLSRFPLARGRPLVGYTAAVVLSALALAVRLWINSGLPPGFPFLTFFPAVVVTVFLFGLGPGILAAILGFFLSKWFFIAPVYTLSFSGGQAVAMGLYTFVVVIDIALVHLLLGAYRQAATMRENSQQLADHRKILFQELQHRVGNNLQMVSALLALQKRKLVEPEARTALDDASRRVGMIGRIQRQLYDPSGSQLNLRGYLDGICRDIVGTCGREGIVHRVVAGESIMLTSDAAIPLALTVAEVVSNAIEHGFDGLERGQIVVTIAQAGPEVRITIADDGLGLPEGFELSAASSLGLRLVQTLLAGQAGTFALTHGNPGTIASITVVRQHAATD